MALLWCFQLYSNPMGSSYSQGLEDQLLGRVIVTEKQELESEKVKLMEEVTQYKRKMKELEDNLLFKLTSTQVSGADVIYSRNNLSIFI